MKMQVSLSFTDSDGLNLTGTQTVTVNCSPTPLRVEFYLDNVLVHTDSSAPFTWDWDTTAGSDGTHVVRVEGVFKSRRAKAQEAVTVSNNAPPPPPPGGGGFLSNPF